jgi:hypothetical protein
MRKRLRGGSSGQVFRITEARQSLADDVRGRQRRYVISMLIRTVSVILAASLWQVQRPVVIVALVLGAVLPYVAVVIANAGRENTPSLPSTFVTSTVRPMIAPPRTDEDAEGGPGRPGQEPQGEAPPAAGDPDGTREPREPQEPASTAGHGAGERD